MTVSPSLKMSRVRSADIVDHNVLEQLEVCIIGAGAIGSNVAFLLGKLGVGRLVIFDDDEVSEENLEPQFYTYSDVGRGKVHAVERSLLKTSPDVAIEMRPYRFAHDTHVGWPIIVGGVDSIESRKEIARALMTQKDNWQYYIDGRMGGNIVELYCVTPESIQSYWFELVEAEPLNIPCSARATSYNGMLIASLIARQVAAISKGQPVIGYMHLDMLAWGVQLGRLQCATAVL